MAEASQATSADMKQPTHQRPAVGRGGAALMNLCNGNISSPWGQQQQQQPHHVGYQGTSDWLYTGYLSSVPPPPRNSQRHSGDFALHQAQFMRACGLCKRRLGPGKDTFMYRGEVAFCSLECRQQQMNQDERKEKCARASMKRGVPKPATKSEASGDSETAAAT